MGWLPFTCTWSEMTANSNSRPLNICNNFGIKMLEIYENFMFHMMKVAYLACEGMEIYFFSNSLSSFSAYSSVGLRLETIY